MLLSFLALGLSSCGGSSADEVDFRHDGVLEFLRAVSVAEADSENGAPSTGMKSLAKIDIEVSDEPLEHARGLKYRSAMEENQGMFFVFAFEGMQSFWMQDTKISLDIIYVNTDLRIVHIAENTVPFSEDQIPSLKPARYVVEVNAGFCKRHDIRVGDYISTKPIDA